LNKWDYCWLEICDFDLVTNFIKPRQQQCSRGFFVNRR
jgi:hypothetical protein